MAAGAAGIGETFPRVSESRAVTGSERRSSASVAAAAEIAATAEVAATAEIVIVPVAAKPASTSAEQRAKQQAAQSA
jgi:hypothetical protein